MGQFPICKLKWDLLRTSVTACTIDENTFSAPFGIFYVRKEIFQKKHFGLGLIADPVIQANWRSEFEDGLKPGGLRDVLCD